MTRQAVTQHLGRLEGANLVATIRRGGRNCTTSTRCRFMISTNVAIREAHSSWSGKSSRARRPGVSF